MDALRDPSCLRDLLLSSPLERFGHGRFAVTAVAPRQATDFSRGRYKFRLFFFLGPGSRPVMAVDLESDLLGTWRMTSTTSEGSRIIASFDEAPDYEAFKAMALGVAEAESAVDSGSANPVHRAARGAPRGAARAEATGSARNHAKDRHHGKSGPRST